MRGWDEQEHPRGRDGRWVERLSARLSRVWGEIPGKEVEGHRLSFLNGTKRVGITTLRDHPEWFRDIEILSPGPGGIWFVPQDIIPSRHPLRGNGIDAPRRQRFQLRARGGVRQPVAMFTVSDAETVVVRSRRSDG